MSSNESSKLNTRKMAHKNGVTKRTRSQEKDSDYLTRRKNGWTGRYGIDHSLGVSARRLNDEILQELEMIEDLEEYLPSKGISTQDEKRSWTF